MIIPMGDKEAAREYWKTLLAGGEFPESATPEEVADLLRARSKFFTAFFQLAMKGTGRVTLTFKADGDPGEQTYLSLKLQYEAAGSLVRSQAVRCTVPVFLRAIHSATGNGFFYILIRAVPRSSQDASQRWKYRTTWRSQEK